MRHALSFKMRLSDMAERLSPMWPWRLMLRSMRLFSNKSSVTPKRLSARHNAFRQLTTRLVHVGVNMARHGFASSDSDEERLGLNAKRQARQLMAWQGLERRLTARRNLALKKLSDIRAMIT